MPCTTASPSPVPWPTCLVVKNGSNTRARVASSMPQPLSAIHRCARGPASSAARPGGARRRPATARRRPRRPGRPRCGRGRPAARARRWCTGSSRPAATCVASARTCTGASGSVTRSSTCAGSAARSMSSVSSMTGCSACVCSSCACMRLNVRICCTRLRARTAARSICSRLASLGQPDRRVLARRRHVADDGGQDVVEVVRDAAGERADRLHLLRVAQLRLERGAALLGRGGAR